MSKPLEILKKYWNYDAFRIPQNEIIESVLKGKDTLALLPTGGGKSITYQVPSLILDGICLVISPLVALMKDQVKNLQNKGIKAIALTGGISQNEIIDLLDNCQFGNYKFLYLSPERLQMDWIMERIQNLPINLIAVDEAHCISQWGNDFRPAYLKIASLKTHFPKIPFLAVTATATQRVKNDIITSLQFENPAIYNISFGRANLAYMTFLVEDKLYLMHQIFTKNRQPAIVYVNNRKSCTDVVNQLQSVGFNATYYHGGLSAKEKDTHMNHWMSEKCQIMVSTNAFGMGIDKANVKTVVHLHIPPNLENYYQEAGRAGRNGEKAFAVLLTNQSDIVSAEKQFISNLCDKSFLLQVYVKLCNYFQIAYGEGLDEKFTFNLHQFCTKYNFPIVKTFNALQFLDNQSIVTLSQEFSEKVSLQFIIESKEVIRYISLNPNDEQVVLSILRTNPGIYEFQTVINIPLIAKKSNCTEEHVLSILEKLKQKQIIELLAKNNDATLTFNEVREDERTINRISKYLEAQNNLKQNQLNAVFDYVKNESECKNKILLAYFDEKVKKNCGICSYCLSKKKKNTQSDLVQNKILDFLKIQDFTSRELQKMTKYPKEEIIFALQFLLENNLVLVKPNNYYSKK